MRLGADARVQRTGQHLLGTIGRCTERLEKALHLAPPADTGNADGADGAGGAIRAAGDANFASKLALTMFAAGVTGVTVFLIQPDPIGTVHLSADAVVVTAVMAQAHGTGRPRGRTPWSASRAWPRPAW